MCHSQSMKTLEVEESDNLFHSCKVKTEKVKPLQISVLSTADPRFMTTEHRKTESDDYLCQLRQDALDRPTDFDAFLKLGDAYAEESEMQNATLAYKKAV